MKATDVNLDRLTNNEFLFDLPIPFPTEQELDKKNKEIQKIDEQIEQAEGLLIKRKKQASLVNDILKKLKDQREQIVSKDSDLKIYPILMKDSFEFENLIWAFVLEKNVPELYDTVEDYAKGVSTPYLDFIIMYTVGANSPELLASCLQLIQMAFRIHIDSYQITVGDDMHYNLLINDKYCLSKDDFDTLRKVIVYENLNVVINDFKNDAQREKEKADAIRAKDVDSPTLEAKITSFCVHKRCTKQDVMNMTMRTFMLESQMIIDVEQYELTSIGIMSGNIILKGSQKTDFQHYLYKKKKVSTMESEGFVPQEDIQKKLKG